MSTRVAGRRQLETEAPQAKVEAMCRAVASDPAARYGVKGVPLVAFKE